MHRFDVSFIMTNPGQPEAPGVIVNTWHFDSIPSPAEDYDNVRDILEDFYQDLVTASVLGLEYVEEVVIQAYALADPTPRTPVYSSTITLTGGATQALPPEVAICFSFEAERQSGTVRGRRRNRKYLAPITATCVDEDGYIVASRLTAIATAGREMMQAAAAATSWEWQVYSQTDETGLAIADGWVDNSFDTQRRRSFRSTSRVIFDSSTPPE